MSSGFRKFTLGSGNQKIWKNLEGSEKYRKIDEDEDKPFFC